MSLFSDNSVLGFALLGTFWVLANLILLAATWGDAARIRAPFSRLPEHVQQQLGIRSPEIGPRNYPRKTLFYGFPDYCDPTAEERAALRRGRIAGHLFYALFLVTLFLYFGHLAPVLFFTVAFFVVRLFTPRWPDIRGGE